MGPAKFRAERNKEEKKRKRKKNPRSACFAHSTAHTRAVDTPAANNQTRTSFLLMCGQHICTVFINIKEMVR